MPRDIGYDNQYENCFFTQYGLQAANVYAQKMYCKNGISYYRHNNEKVDGNNKCDDWCEKCSGLVKACGVPNPKRPKPRRYGDQDLQIIHILLILLR